MVVMRYLILTLAGILTACDGGDATVTTVPPTVVVPPTPEKPEKPEKPDPVKTEEWAKVWEESWAGTVFGGYVRHTALRCAGQKADTEQPRGREVRTTGATWSYFSSGGASFWPDGGVLRFSTYTPGAILAWETFEPSEPLRVEAPVFLEKREGAWVGITLIQDESDYREISLQWDKGKLFVELYAPCYSQRLVEVSEGVRNLALEYDKHSGWTYEVDGEKVHFEPIDNLGARLIGKPRVGVYAAVHNTLPGANLGPAAGTVGAIVVKQLESKHAD
jgi:hypothetical protein